VTLSKREAVHLVATECLSLWRTLSASLIQRKAIKQGYESLEIAMEMTLERFSCFIRGIIVCCEDEAQWRNGVAATSTISRQRSQSQKRRKENE